MNPERRLLILVVVMLVGAGGLALWSARGMIGARDSAQVAAEDYAACRTLADSIKLLRGKPAVASTEVIGSQELGQRIDAALRQAQLDPKTLDGVFPQAARHVGDSPYVQKPTALALRGVTLKQLATFLFSLTEGSGLAVRDLRLRVPSGDAARDLWDAEATLVYLIFEPPGKAGRGGPPAGGNSPPTQLRAAGLRTRRADGLLGYVREAFGAVGAETHRAQV